MFGKRTVGATLGLVAALGLGSATPAAAAEAGTLAVHRGTAGCINYSWGDGSLTWTVYYSNTCNSKKTLMVKTGTSSLFETCITVGANAKGSKVFYNKPIGFKSTC